MPYLYLKSSNRMAIASSFPISMHGCMRPTAALFVLIVADMVASRLHVTDGDWGCHLIAQI
jgi:hypothetical protein